MKAKTLHILLIISFLTFLYSCSTKKNTWLSRNYQTLNTRYNVFFNGYESYKGGLVKLSQNHVDDYSEVLLMYPISYHANASTVAGDMDRAIEKSQKAIKTRSIRKKPKKNPGKSKDPDYQAFMSKEEYNTMIDDAWLLLGKSEFHKADFLGAAATFTYVIRHFSTEKEIVAEAQLWLVRSYAEMDWIYEAEDILNKINQDGFSSKQTTFFSAVNADLLLKQKRYNEAIPYLVLAINGEKNKKQKARFQYILAQLYQLRGDNENAYAMYKAVAKSNPPFEMAVNAQIKQSETYAGADKADQMKALRKMAKNSKYSDYLDQIYGAIGNIYLNNDDLANAIANYKLAIEKSTRNGYEKAQSLITLADIYYKQENYREAQPYYEEAAAIMNPLSSDFNRVDNLSQTLSELTKNIEMVHLQDSLQILSRLPDSEKEVRIKNIIAQVIKEEEEARKREEEERLKAENIFGANAMSYDANTNMLMQQLGGGRNTSFYFYNPQLMAAGKNDFQKKWGTRKLEDDWRRQVKTQVADFFAETDVEEFDEAAQQDSTSTANAAVTDNKKPEFYYQQLFTTPEQFETSDNTIITSLYDIAFIYNDKINNMPKAIETLEELERRFPSNAKLPDVYFFLYQTYTRQNEQGKADVYRAKLISEFPENKYARILAQPDYMEKLSQMNAEQDSLYEKTYYEYLASNYDAVFNNYTYMDSNYPASPLMPKFALLYSLSKAKTDTPENFRASLEELVVKYPESDVISIAKDMLALMAQGKESQTGDSHGGLLTLRSQETQQSLEADAGALEFKPDLQETHLFVIYIPKDRVDIYKLQYNIAAYNFTKFLIKDFDLEIRNYYDDMTFLIVRNLENLDEALWYQSGIEADNYLSGEIRDNALTNFVISKDNFDLVFTTFTVEEYIDFFNSDVAKNSAQRIVNRIGDTVKARPKTELAQVEKQDTKPVQSKPAEPVKPAETKPAESKPVKPVEATSTESKPAETKPVEETQKPVETSTPETPAEVKPVEPTETETAQPVQETSEPVTPEPEPTVEEPEKPAEPEVAPAPEPKKELPKFRGLYTFDETAKHYFAFYILDGTFDFEKVKADIDKYNAENYPLLNMQISQATSGKQKIILIGMLPDAASAKSYLLRIVKNRELFAGLQGSTYRNLIITEDNLEVLDRIGNPGVYMDFIREQYLK